MSRHFDELVKGLSEAIEYERGEGSLKKTTLSNDKTNKLVKKRKKLRS